MIRVASFFSKTTVGIWFTFSTLLISLTSMEMDSSSKFKAIFIYKFVEYIEFPQGKTKLKMGIMGDSEIKAEMESIMEAKKNLNIEVSQIKDHNEISSYDIIFIPDNQSQNLGLILNFAKKSGVLIIADKKELAGKGAAISFYLEGGKLKFVIDKSIVDSNKLQVSGSLLGLATVI